MTTKITVLGGLTAVEVSGPGRYPTVFACLGRFPFGERELDVRVVKGITFTGDREAALAAFEEHFKNK
jgi:hypothetical protein